MSNYRRYFVPGGSYFFTINLLERRDHPLLTTHIDALRDAVRRTKTDRPFRIDGWVVLPEHMHLMMTLPPGDSDFSNRIKSIKMRFNFAIPATERRSKVRAEKGERGIWQRPFGSTRFAMSTILNGIWTMSISTPSNTGMPHRLALGHIPHFINGLNAACIRLIGRAATRPNSTPANRVGRNSKRLRRPSAERSPTVPLRSAALVEPLRVPPYAAAKSQT